MVFLLGQLVVYAAIGALYVYFLRLASQWAAGWKVSRKLAWAWYGVALGLMVANIFLGPLFPLYGLAGVVSGAVLQVLLGGAFFGLLAKDAAGIRLGLAKGVATVGIGAAMMFAVAAVLYLGANYLLGDAREAAVDFSQGLAAA